MSRVDGMVFARLQVRTPSPKAPGFGRHSGPRSTPHGSFSNASSPSSVGIAFGIGICITSHPPPARLTARRHPPPSSRELPKATGSLFSVLVVPSLSMAAAAPPAASRRGWFAVPAPVRGLFDIFPLRVYGPEALPLRSPAASRARPTLYVFIADDDAPHGLPSFNPSCLKWQTLLRIAGVDVDIVPSNNHASPSGALPFLLPPSLASSRPSVPLTGEKIHKYALEHTSRELPDISSPRLEAYQALLTQNIRPAWLHALYLIPANVPLLTSLYLPTSILLRAPIHHTLHAAATSEILKTTRSAHISPPQLYADAAAALRSLSAILADDEWFFGSFGPGLFDADVFAYTYLMLDDALAWQDSSLAGCLDGLHNLRRHRQRLYDHCWGQTAK